MYLSDSVPAQRALEDAGKINADLWAPYEYFLAQALLEKAAEEAADASYQMSARFAEKADVYANKAIDLTRERKKASEDAQQPAAQTARKHAPTTQIPVPQTEPQNTASPKSTNDTQTPVAPSGNK